MAQDGGDSVIFMGGSFWSLERFMSGIPGTTVEVGYAGNERWKPKDESGAPNPRPNFYNLNGTGFSEAARFTYGDARGLEGLLGRYVLHLSADQTDEWVRGEDGKVRYRRAILTHQPRVTDAVRALVAKRGLRTVRLEHGRLFFPAEPAQRGKWIKAYGPYEPQQAAAKV